MNSVDTASVETKEPQEVSVNSNIPSVNRLQAINHKVTYIGFGVILLVGIGYGALNFGGKPSAPAVSGKAATKEGFTTPAALVKPTAPPAPVGAASGSGVGSAGIVAPGTVVPGIPGGPLNAAPIGLQGGRYNAAPVTPVKPVLGWLDRKMEGVLLLSGDKASSVVPGRPSSVGPNPLTATADTTPVKLTSSTKDKDKTEVASMLGDRNFLITKGTSLDCALETALDSTLPGITTCRTTRDVYSDNGQVLLLDRGTQLVGEYQGGMKQGQARVYVMWTRAKTPNGVIILLNSPGIDALGRSGFDGYVDNHFMERFGAAILMSFMKDSVGLLASKSSGGTGTTNLYGNSAAGGEKVIEKILDASANIPPTLMKNQGEHIQVMVAKDLDFSTVYGLQAKPKIM